MTDRLELLDRIIHDTLQRLNGLYGRGHIESFSFDESTGEGMASISVYVTQRSKVHFNTRRFRVKGSTLYYAGHQAKIIIPA